MATGRHLRLARHGTMPQHWRQQSTNQLTTILRLYTRFSVGCPPPVNSYRLSISGIPTWILRAEVSQPLDFMVGEDMKVDGFADRQEEALRILAQGQSEIFATYLPRFERFLAQVGMVLADDKTKISHLYGTLNERMYNAIIPLDEYHHYPEFANKLQSIGSRLDMLAHCPKASTQRLTHRTTVAASIDAIDGEPIPRAARTRLHRNAWTNKLANEGRCFHCFNKDHVAASCLNARAAVPVRFRHLLKDAAPEQARAAWTDPVPVWDDEDNGDAEHDFW